MACSKCEPKESMAPNEIDLEKLTDLFENTNNVVITAQKIVYYRQTFHLVIDVEFDSVDDNDEPIRQKETITLARIK